MLTVILLFSLHMPSDFSDELKSQFDTTRKLEVNEARKEVADKKKLLENVLAGKITIRSAGNKNSAQIARAQLLDAEKNLKSLESNSPPFVPTINTKKKGSVGVFKNGLCDVVEVRKDGHYILQLKFERQHPNLGKQLQYGAKIALIVEDKTKVLKEGSSTKLGRIYQVLGTYELGDSKITKIPLLKTLNITDEELLEWAKATGSK